MRLFFFIVVCIGSFQNTNHCWSANTIDEQTDCISRRWYLVDRLTKPMQVLEKLYKGYCEQLLPLDFPVTISITDPEVNKCLQSLMNGKKITPVLELWQQIRSYKYVSHAALPGDFVLLVCILLRHCSLCLHQLHIQEDICEQIQIPYEKLLSWDTVQILDLIAQVTNYLKGRKYACLVNNRTGGVPSARYLDIATTDISLRFCLASRLKKTFDWLSIFKNKKVSFFKTMITRDQSSFIVDDYVHLYHPRMVTCCKEMAQTESLAPFIALWKQFRCFEEIHDVQFLKDFLKLVFVTYHYLFLGNMIKKNDGVDNLVQEMHGWSIQINEYSAMQILDVIDVIEHSCDECKMTLITKKQPVRWLENELQLVDHGWQILKHTVMNVINKKKGVA